jgi:hypothetical protein
MSGDITLSNGVMTYLRISDRGVSRCGRCRYREETQHLKVKVQPVLSGVLQPRSGDRQPDHRCRRAARIDDPPRSDRQDVRR